MLHEQQNVANSQKYFKAVEMRAFSKFHQNVANSMDKERFELKNAANTVEMAASSSKMLQIARKMDRTGSPKTVPKRKTNIARQFQTLCCLGRNLENCSHQHGSTMVNMSISEGATPEA